MNNFKKSKSGLGNVALILGSAFVLYNVLLFLIAGFSDHGAGFWLSYVFTLLPFASIVICGMRLNCSSNQPKDWIFGFPIIKHCFIYLIAQVIISVIFMALDDEISWKIGFIIQFIMLAAHIALVATSFLAKSTIEKTQTKVKDATNYIRLLQVDAEMVAQKCEDPETKTAFLKLAEAIRYSDPMSNPALFELEKQIAQHVSAADRCVFSKDYSGAMWCCQKASELLTERNKKCMVLK